MHEVFDRTITAWDKMYKSRSFLHVFEQDGISTQDMMESRFTKFFPYHFGACVPQCADQTP